MNKYIIKKQVKEYEESEYKEILKHYKKNISKHKSKENVITVTYHCRTTYILCCY